jgi:glutaredoxin 2
LLLAYDKHKDHPEIILQTAKDIAGWLLKEDEEVLPYEIRIINYLQTIKRERELTDEENKKLYEISEKSDSLMNKLGANLLLENYKVARIQFDMLNDEEKEAFKSFPIYRFWK